MPSLREAGVNNFELRWDALVGLPTYLPHLGPAGAREVPALVRDGDARQKLFNAGRQANKAAHPKSIERCAA